MAQAEHGGMDHPSTLISFLPSTAARNEHERKRPRCVALGSTSPEAAGELSARDAANQVAEQMQAEVIQVIGRTFTLYRENPELKRGAEPPWR